MAIKSIIFDLDDTLYNEKMFVINGFKEVSFYLNKLTGLDYNMFYVYLVRDLVRNGRGSNFNSLIKYFKLNDEVDVNTLLNIYRSNEIKLTLYCDAEWIINKLKQDYAIGLITDGNSISQSTKIKNLNICNLFDKIILTGDYGGGYEKPNGRSYLEMLAYFKHEPKKSVYIGDNPFKDFLCPNAIGMKTFRLMRGEYREVIVDSKYDAKYKLKCLSELLKFI